MNLRFNKISFYVKDIILNSVASSYVFPVKVRRMIYGMYGHNVSRVFPDCFLGYGKGKLKMGQNSYCNYRCFFDLGDDITIGDNVSIGMNVSFINSSHEIGPSTGRAGKDYAKPIMIEDGCWVGANVTILTGVTIKKGCIVAAASVVTSNCEPNGLYLGIPARRVKDLE